MDRIISSSIIDSLAPREYQVFKGLASGQRVTDIADELSLSAKTISTYRQRVLSKLDVKSNQELGEIGRALGIGPNLTFKIIGKPSPRNAE